MRCLGIPNTAHFANITKIDDAIELWKKLRDEKEKEVFKPELEVSVYTLFGTILCFAVHVILIGRYFVVLGGI